MNLPGRRATGLPIAPPASSRAGPASGVVSLLAYLARRCRTAVAGPPVRPRPGWAEGWAARSPAAARSENLYWSLAQVLLRRPARKRQRAGRPDELWGRSGGAAIGRRWRVWGLAMAWRGGSDARIRDLLVAGTVIHGVTRGKWCCPCSATAYWLARVARPGCGAGLALADREAGVGPRASPRAPACSRIC